jgi:hypothetical protein
MLAGVLRTGEGKAQQAGTDFGKRIGTVLVKITGNPFLDFKNLLAGCLAFDLFEDALGCFGANDESNKIESE